MPRRRVHTPPEIFAAESSIFRQQLGLATTTQLLRRGVTPAQVRSAIEQGRWVRSAFGLYALSSWPVSPGRRLLAACLATGGVASHASAVWLWDLLDEEPESPVVSVAHGLHPTTGNSPRSGGSLTVVIHRPRDLPDSSLSEWHGIPTTNPLRSLVDFAGVTKPELLDGAIDVGLAARLVTVDALLAEARRLKKSGRRGPAQLIAALGRRGFVGAPAPSVLESRALRLLASAGINVVNCETVVDEGRYRLDIELHNHLFIELDGYTYHSSPEQKRRDDARRNRLRILGIEFLVYDWTATTTNKGGFIREVKAAGDARSLSASNLPPARTT